MATDVLNLNWSDSVNYYPNNSAECMAQIDAGFGIDAAKIVACNTFLLANNPNVLDGMAQTAALAQQPIYSSWCLAKAAYLRGEICVPKTCSQVGASCGQASDGCGGTLNCSDCNEGKCIKNQCIIQQPNNIYPDLPKNNTECLDNIDTNMPLDMKISTCKELFDSKNDADTLLAFSSDAQKAGYEIASFWFAQQATEKANKKDYTLYYVVGGIAGLAVIGITIGALAAK